MPAVAFDNSYARLPERFYVRQGPTPVRRPRLLKLNEGLAKNLELDSAWLQSEAGVAMLAGNAFPETAAPLAQAYAGHQFGGFSPQLGDGRALLIGEVIGRDGVRRDVQLKGSGPTPFSRRGDGRAALGPVIREYIIAEAMHALGISTTRSLAVVASGEPVMREGPQPGGVLTRVAQSHIRVGTFQFFAARGDAEGVRTLADYVIARHYPDLGQREDRYLALLDAVVGRQADLIAQWLNVGFIHGVMNTDNMTVSGETIDYGPCAFMDTYNPAQVYSSIDEHARYAYGNQPRIGLWNLTRFAETLLDLIDADSATAVKKAEAVLDTFAARFNTAHIEGLRRKLGLFEAREGDAKAAAEFLDLMAQGGADYTLTFRALSEAAFEPAADAEVRRHFADPAAYDAWAQGWRQRCADENGTAEDRRALMRTVNPAYIPRNHRVEEAISAAVVDGDLRPFETLVTVLQRPFDDQPEFADYRLAPEPEQIVRATFCGT